MTQDQVLLAILGGLILLDIAFAIWAALRVRRRSQLTQETPGETGSLAAADVEAFVAGVLPDPPGPARQPAASSPGADGDGVDPLPAVDSSMSGIGWSSTPPEWPARLGDAAAWSRAIREESARFARFGHPVTVVMAELPHLDSLSAGLGREMADRVARETARLLVAEGRAADRMAWFPDARFGILLLETDEKTAAGYVRRVRTATDHWLESVGLSIRLSLGWAGPGNGTDVVAAATAAEQRMHAASRGPARVDTPSAVGDWP